MKPRLRIVTHEMNDPEARSYHWPHFTLDHLTVSPLFLPRPIGTPPAGRIHKSGITDPIIDCANKRPWPGEDLSVTMIPRVRTIAQGPRKGVTRAEFPLIDRRAKPTRRPYAY